jgi:phytoene/squalene synthetase
MSLYNSTSYAISRIVTGAYSTSFSWGIKAFAKEFRDPIYAVYAYVRLADEIVDTFHDYDKRELLERFRNETFKAINEKISTNPVLHAFQETVNKYNIDPGLIEAFLDSMEKDLSDKTYDKTNFDEYIYGSAEVVGLMCLYVFCSGDRNLYNSLYPSAMKLGAAFQKVNFLRDIRSDIEERGRIYIPGISGRFHFNDEAKSRIEEEVESDFKEALKGILQLPPGVKLGVYSAYLYYYMLFRKIRRLNINELLKARVRISNFTKTLLLLRSFLKIKVLDTV